MEELYKNHTIKIVVDETPQDPREYDNLATIFCFHSRYNIGDKHNYTKELYTSWEDFKRQLKKDLNIIPNTMKQIKMYDHSGIGLAIRPEKIATYPYNCRFDSMWVGWIFLTYENVEKMMGWSRQEVTLKRIKQLNKSLLSEFDTYNSFIQGDCFGFQIVTLDENGEEIEEVDSCYGYFDSDYCLEEAKAVVDNAIKYNRKKRVNLLKKWIKNKVPLHLREFLLGQLKEVNYG